MKIKDSKLLLLISEKDVKAFDTFYYRYIKMIYRFVFRELNDEVLTDDLIQEFWLRVWEDPGFLKCNDKGSVQAYMLQHMKFRVLDLYRKTLTGLLQEFNSEKVERDQLDYDNITEELNEKELLGIIQEALKNQSPIIRNTFWMRINNWTVEETSRALSVSNKTIYNKYSESLTVVRAHIRDHYPEFADIRKVRTES
jgi:RNA polymerase sigma-70 factor (ECF subfamily)